MRLLTGKRIGQSRNELSSAVLFSFFIHIIAFFSVFFLSQQVRQRIVVPPFYRVNLVALPADAPEAPPSAVPSPAPPQPAPPKPKARAPQPAVRAVPKPAPAPALAPKEAMPDLDAEKKAAKEQAAPPAEVAPKKTQAVSVASASPESQTAPEMREYLVRVRARIEPNWNPPKGAKGLKSRISFKVLRSGRVGEVKLEEASGNFYFDQAAMRAIYSSSPFPQLPEGFFKDFELFSVDLMEKE